MNIGIKDEDFVRGKVPMTKEEIRILTLVKARITPDTVVYDVGAGTGSISIEAARMAPQGHVYAIEKNPDGIALIAENAKKFGAENITIVEGTAPDALADLPALDAAIIGGSGRKLADILDIIGARLRPQGRSVANADQSIGACWSLRYGKGAQSHLYHYGREKVRRADDSYCWSGARRSGADHGQGGALSC